MTTPATRDAVTGDAPPDAAGAPSTLSRALRVCVALVLVVLSIFPVADWLGVELGALLAYSADGWWSGTAIVGLLTGLMVLAAQRSDLSARVTAALAPVIRAWEQRPVLSIGSAALLAGVVYAVDAQCIFGGFPLLIDEIVQVVQARMFTEGMLWQPAGAHPEFRSMMHLVEQDGRVYGQFPPGGPLMLALGVLVGAPWLVNPLFGAVSVAAFALALRWAGVGAGLGLGATVLFGFSPFIIFQSASHMNHVTALTWILVAVAALVRATHSSRDLPWAGLLCGLGLGVAATIRPLDAVAFALPAGAWLGWQAVTQRRWGAFLLSGVGIALPMLLMFWANAQMTGHPLTFGYQVLWGSQVGLGFHEAPWGEPHTVQRGLAMLAAYFNRLSDHLFETPVPAMVPVALSIALGRRASGFERYLYVSAGLLVAAYFAYWHDGFYLGPRFFVPLVPVLALLVAQLPGVIGARWPRVPALKVGAYASFVAAGVAGLIFVMPVRVALHRVMFASLRHDYGALAAAAGARDSNDLVIVRESWGAQLMVRLWALGISRPEAELLYRYIDSCVLDGATAQLDATGVRGAAARAALWPLLADSARVEKSTLSPDATERVLPGTPYGTACRDRIAEDRAGFAHFPPVWLASDAGGLRWARDLQARDTLIARRGDRVWLLWLLREEGQAPRPVVQRIDGDSLWRAWGWAGAVQDSAR